MTIKENSHQEWQRNPRQLQVSFSGGFQHFLEICRYLSVACSSAVTRKTNSDSQTPPSSQQSLAPMQHCNNYRISNLKGHHQDTFRKVCALEKGQNAEFERVYNHEWGGRKHVRAMMIKSRQAEQGEQVRVWFGSLRVGHGSDAFESRSRSDYTADRKSNAILCSLEPELGRSGRRKFSQCCWEAPGTTPGHKGARSSFFSSEGLPATI